MIRLSLCLACSDSADSSNQGANDAVGFVMLMLLMVVIFNDIAKRVSGGTRATSQSEQLSPVTVSARREPLTVRSNAGALLRQAPSSATWKVDLTRVAT